MTTDEPPAARMGLARGFPVPLEQGLEVEARVRSEVQGREVGVSYAIRSKIHEVLASLPDHADSNDTRSHALLLLSVWGQVQA